MSDVKKVNGGENRAEVRKSSEFISTDEKAQYEVFRNGSLPRETIEKWVRNDLTAIMSFVHGCLKDEEIFTPLVDAFYERYRKLHANNQNNDQKIAD